MHKADDSDILQFARKEERVCVTLDHDFHSHLARAGHGKPSVILIRAEHLKANAQAELIQKIVSQCEAALDKGAAISADRQTIRVRHLPLK